MSRALARYIRRRSALIGSILAALTLVVTSGCGQRGALVLPDSAQLPSPRTSPPQSDEEDAQPQEQERTENER